jgi:hypothetical protein
MPPLRPPDTRDLATRRQRALASADASRYDLANRIFNVAAKNWFGPRARMPLIYWRSRTPGGEIDMQRAPVMNTAQAWSKWQRGLGAPVGRITYPTMLDTWPDAGNLPPFRVPLATRRQHFMDILLHELAHTQQGAGYPSKLAVEGGADAFTALARNQVAKELGFGPYAAMPFVAGYGHLFQRYLAKYGPQRALFGQFGQRGRLPPPHVGSVIFDPLAREQF